MPRTRQRPTSERRAPTARERELEAEIATLQIGSDHFYRCWTREKDRADLLERVLKTLCIGIEQTVQLGRAASELTAGRGDDA